MATALWRKKNKEKISQYSKTWKKKNPEYVKECVKKWAKKNPEARKAIQKTWRRKKPEYIKEYGKKWREKNKEKMLGQKMLVTYYNSCCFNYTYRMQALIKILEQHKLIMERLQIFKKHEKWDELRDIFKELPNLYIEHIVYFYYDYYCKYYKTADIQKMHLELMIVLAKKENILFPENLIYETFEEQQSLVFYILFQMHEKYCKAIEDGENFIEILDKAGFEKRFILEPFDFEKRE